MKVTRLQARYTRALFDEADRAGEARLVLEEIKAVAGVLGREPSLVRLLTHPRVPGSRREELLVSVLGGRVGARARDFLALLARRAAIDALDGIVRLFEAKVLEREGIARARVITAVPIDDTQRTMIVRRLEKLVGRTIEMTHDVDGSIVGGIVIRIGDRLIDGSVRFHLERIREDLKRIRIV